jgi:nitroimidazol reductase NimA-like FMN-containing flavoprotein (pyridoxamine 5'-phosphate oxidase superfamily)
MNLPSEMLRLLKGEKLCTLATSYVNRPHAFLMVFTYLSPENLLIMSSRTDSSKVKHIQENPEVALLFYNTGKGSEPPISCTLYGTASVLPPANDSYYRESHYDHHRDKGTFIKGENISIIAVKLRHAVMSDAQDSVNTWAAEDNCTQEP